MGPDAFTLRPAMPKPPNRGADDDDDTLGAAKLSATISEPMIGDIEMGLGDGIVHDASIGGLDRVLSDNEGNASVGILPYDALVEAVDASWSSPYTSCKQNTNTEILATLQA